MTDEKKTGRNVSRRAVLKGAGAAATGLAFGATAACSDDDSVSATPDALDGSDAVDMDSTAETNTSLQPLRGDGSHPFHYIDTVVIVQMENRSFDHYFGSYTLDEGRTDIDGLTASMSNPTGDGTAIPIEFLTDDYIIHPDPAHSHSKSLAQFNNGANDGFITTWEGKLSQEEYDEKIGWPLGYYKRDQLPAFYPLADNFTLCDRWFSSVLGPTWPNRFFSHAATSEGQFGNDKTLAGRTIYNIVEEAGLSFATYHQVIYYFMVLLEQADAGRFILDFDLERFHVDAENGTLPNVTVVEPDYAFNDDHPPQDVRQGQAFVTGIYEALRRSPQWERTLMVVFYDEHGGFYDHVAPPKTEGDTRASEGFDQLGFRVPGILIGPLVKRGHVMHTVVDHASIPALISEIFQIDHINERARKAGRFDDAFDLELIDERNRPTPPVIEQMTLSEEKLRFGLAQPHGQPELKQFVDRKYNIDFDSRDHSLRKAESYFRRLEDLRVARIGR